MSKSGRVYELIKIHDAKFERTKICWTHADKIVEEDFKEYIKIFQSNVNFGNKFMTEKEKS